MNDLTLWRQGRLSYCLRMAKIISSTTCWICGKLISTLTYFLLNIWAKAAWWREGYSGDERLACS